MRGPLRLKSNHDVARCRKSVALGACWIIDPDSWISRDNPRLRRVE
jgi:hypothetical protein